MEISGLKKNTHPVKQTLFFIIFQLRKTKDRHGIKAIVIQSLQSRIKMHICTIDQGNQNDPWGPTSCFRPQKF